MLALRGSPARAGSLARRRVDREREDAGGLLVDAVAGPDGPVVFHSLRHTGISRLANDRRIPLVQVRDFARHKSLTTTETYVQKIDSPELTAAMAAAMALEHSWHTDSGPLGSDGE
jgi:integrase